MHTLSARITRLMTALLCGILLQGCANIGSPDGGPRDYVPPRLVKASPPLNALNVNRARLEFTFDENVNIKDQQKRVSISPAQQQPPVIRSNGKKVTVELRDSLLPNTTYVVDFSDAIEDNNEGNPLEDFCYAFSTGETLDTLRISGIALRAFDLEPMQHVLVGLHSNLSDTAFTHTAFERVARTNSRGEFTLRNLSPGNYRIFALNDVDGDLRYARTEDMAWNADIITPTTDTFTSVDTIFTFDHRVDTILPAAVHTEFLPNNVLLSMFNQQYRSHYLRRAERLDAHRLHVLLSAPPDTAPRLRLLDPPAQRNDWYIPQYTAAGDSLHYWLTDSTLLAADSLRIELTYLRTDSTEHLHWQTDTLVLEQRKTNAQIKAEQQAAKEREQRQKRAAVLQEKINNGQTLSDNEQEELAEVTRVEAERLKVEADKSSLIEVTDTFGLRFEVPIKRIDPNGIHLSIKRDTIWHPLHLPDTLCRAYEGDPLRYVLPMTFSPDSAYRLSIDTLAIESIYGITCDPQEFEFKVRAEEEYATLRLFVNAPDGSIVQLLNTSENVIAADTVTAGKVVLCHILPATYYLKLVLDSNHNGRWDTGNYALNLQPEQVCYFPTPLRLRRNWDVEQHWDIFATALDRQKPNDIKRNQPENRNKLNKDTKKKKDRSDEDEEDLDEFNSSGFSQGTYSGNRYRDYQNNRKR